MTCDSPVIAAKKRSVHEHARFEADEYKWIISELAKCDKGDPALGEWRTLHWNGFVRARWIEHLEGEWFWVELDRDDFGLLHREFGDRRPLLDAIVCMLKCGAENLDIYRWARDSRIPYPHVREILDLLNINAHRLTCSF